MRRLKEKLKAIYRIIVDNSKMNYYFVSYAHEKGFGRANYSCKGKVGIRQLEIGIMESGQKKEVVILHYQKISKEQSLGGFI